MRNDFPDFDEKKELYEKIKQKEEQLKKELDRINADQQGYLNRINEIEAEAEGINEKIAKAKNEEGTINERELQLNCNETVEQFLKDVDLQGVFSLSIIIEYEQMKIFKNLTEKDMTFGKLKEETQMQFGKEANEFYFGDINNNIYPDELRVIPALFPLSLVKVDKYEPVIRVIDKAPIKKLQSGDALEKLEEMDKIEEDQTGIVRKKVITKKTLFICLNVFFVIFIGVWSQCCINYMYVDDYKVYKKTYFGDNNPLIRDGCFELNDSTRYSPLELKIKNFKDELGLEFYNKTNDQGSNDGNSGTTSTGDQPEPEPDPLLPDNYIFKKGMFIPKVGESNKDCTVDRLIFNSAKYEDCYSTYEEVEINTNKPKKIFNVEIRGELKTYSTKSYGIPINVSNPSINFDYDPKTLEAFFLVFNLYNRHLNTISTLTILYEKLNKKFYPKAKLEIFPITNSIDALFITSIVFGVLIIITIFLLLANEDRPVQRIVFDEKGNQHLTESIPPFRMPNFHEWLLILNILFFIAIIIFRVCYKTNFKLEGGLLEPETFENLVNYETRFKILNGISFLNLIISYFLLVFFLYDLYPEKLKDLSNTISGYIYDLGGFILAIVIPFIFMSFFTSYVLFGSFGYTEYSNLGFIFLKVVQNLFRGSLDHSDYMSKEKKDKFKIFKGFETTVNYTDDLINATGSAGFILYSLIYFFFSFIVIKGSIIAVCILKYKLVYVGRIEKEEKEKKEAELRERKRKRMEIKKSLEKANKDKNKEKAEPKNIEMVEMK